MAERLCRKIVFGERHLRDVVVLLRALLQRGPNTFIAGQGLAPSQSRPGRRPAAADPWRTTPPVRPNLIRDKDSTPAESTNDEAGCGCLSTQGREALLLNRLPEERKDALAAFVDEFVLRYFPAVCATTVLTWPCAS